MPRYDYRCTECGDEFILVQSFSEAGTGACPVCAGPGQRVFHAVPVIYKGSGFYTTDYGRPKPPVENDSKESKETKESKESKETSSSTTTSAKDSKTSTSQTSSGKSEAKSESPAKAASESGS